MCVNMVIEKVRNCKDASRIWSWLGLGYIKRRNCSQRYIMIEWYWDRKNLINMKTFRSCNFGKRVSKRLQIYVYMRFQVNWISQDFRFWHLKVQKRYKSSKQEHFQKKVHILKVESLLKQLSRNNLSRTN